MATMRSSEGKIAAYFNRRDPRSEVFECVCGGGGVRCVCVSVCECVCVCVCVCV